MPWTAEELAEMAKADAEIEAEFEDEATAYRLARENAEYAEEIDRTARADSLPRAEVNRRRKIAAYKKAYYEANKDEIAAYQKDFYDSAMQKNGPCDALRAFRKEHGYTQRDIAKILGVSSQLVSHWETGRCAFDMTLLDQLFIAAKEKERSYGNTNAQGE